MCWATTQKGKPCQSIGRDEYLGLCGTHWNMLQERLKKTRPDQSPLSDSDKTSDHFAKWVGIISGTIAISEAIYIAWKSLPWGAPPKTPTSDELAEVELATAVRDTPRPSRGPSVKVLDTMLSPPSWTTINDFRKSALDIKDKSSNLDVDLQIKELTANVSRFMDSINDRGFQHLVTYFLGIGERWKV